MESLTIIVASSNTTMLTHINLRDLGVEPRHRLLNYITLLCGLPLMRRYMGTKIVDESCTLTIITGEMKGVGVDAEMLARVRELVVFLQYEGVLTPVDGRRINEAAIAGFSGPPTIH